MKCSCCSKKLSLVDQVAGKCICGSSFCMEHRLPEAHLCKHDYQKAFMEKASSNLCVVVAPKVERI